MALDIIICLLIKCIHLGRTQSLGFSLVCWHLDLGLVGIFSLLK